MDTLKDAIRLHEAITRCFPKGSIRVDHVLLLTSVKIARLDNAKVEGRRAQIHMRARQVEENVVLSIYWRHSLIMLYPLS